MMKRIYMAVAAFMLAAPAYAAGSPVVLELFTSQGCSSCPPADAALQKLAADPRVLALSYHIDYWDSPDWKDPFSLRESTLRQEQYQRVLAQENLYTPELVIDGQQAMIGSRKQDAETTIDVYSDRPKPFGVKLTPAADHKTLTINFTGQKPGDVAFAGVWLVSFNPIATSAVRGGENRGREMTSINNVTSVTRLQQITETNPAPMTVNVTPDPASGYAVLVQEKSGRMIGAGAYVP